jgi:hypothetical protein
MLGKLSCNKWNITKPTNANASSNPVPYLSKKCCTKPKGVTATVASFGKHGFSLAFDRIQIAVCFINDGNYFCYQVDLNHSSSQPVFRLVQLLKLLT